MKRSLFYLVLSMLVMAAAPAGSGSSEAAGPAAQALERFKSLTGEWRGTNNQGHPVRLSYELVADGSAVLERLNIAGETPHDMVTLYHLDEDRLLLTHYCVARNQPRMQAVLPAGEDEIRFEFVDATNLPSPDAGHMHRAVFKFRGDDGLSSAWTFREKGRDAFTAEINVQRVSATTGTAALNN